MIALFASGGTTPFPAVDPIPLPAPVWLFKVLLNLTLTLHFVAVYLLVGGLVIAMVLNYRGHSTKNKGRIDASGAIANWLPIVMTYVINLGVPPLLFAQVLYGRALYTSSVLVAASWIAVIPLLILCYQLLYIMKARVEAERSWYGAAFGALVCAGAIARIYTMNMTLMIEPEVWRETYRLNQNGTAWIEGAAGWARWLAMVVTGIAVSGVALAWLSRTTVSKEGRDELRRHVPLLAGLGMVAAVALGITVFYGQSEAVRQGCASYGLVFTLAVALWGFGALGVVVLSPLLSGTPAKASWKMDAAAALAAFVQIAGFVLCRDLVRDASLARAGFDVWDRAVVVNWSVLILFFVVFIAGLAVVGWLVSVVARQPVRNMKGESL